MKNLKYFLFLSLCGTMVLVSCTKDDVDTNVVEIENYEVEDEINAETFAEDIENAIDDELEFADIFFHDGSTKDGMSKGPTGTDVNANCAQRTASAARGTFPNTVIITLGEGCTGRHGQSIRGQIEVTLSDNPRNADATKTVTLTDFQIGETTINGTRTVTNMGLNDNEQRQLTRTEDITITRGDFTIKRRSNITTTRMAGDNTDTREDDTLERIGTVEGTNSRGETYTTTITSAMVRKGNCRWPVSGVREITRGDRKITLDYGDGTCDNKVTATMGDRSKVFEIR